jgi:hypothetical protein
MKNILMLSVLFLLVISTAGMAGATTLDVYDWSTSTSTPIGQIETIAAAQTGVEHYNYYSVSGHPAGINLGYYNSSLWVHENTNSNEYSFGYIFAEDNGLNNPNDIELHFRIVDSTSNVWVALSDDSGEVVESSPGSFYGDYWYNRNSDGAVIRGITGSDWTIIIDSADLGDITAWYAASGGTSDLGLTLGHEYRIVLEGSDPYGASSAPTPEPTTLLLLGSGLFGLTAVKRKFGKGRSRDN